ncbi:hypothetical protein [Macrococcus armenti]|uniref:hypothetical protein n=1 Tax=Macrococcus armenti TaxID=2875764 RepID=UPI001CC9A860|nr:hypothetical protein [Macrococcus armenti]UBH08443.1 hypothetical protein LAU41_10795 [Macrococcus armenti]UBH10729.1 hypothetical protein LAU38_10995 [Macrococcus armenti]
MEKKTLEEINKEIEDELLNNQDNDGKKEKKGYLSIKFWLMLIILIMVVGKIINNIM